MRAKGLVVGLLALLLAGCTSGPPQAPMGWGRRPANSPETIANLRRPPADLPSAPQPIPSAYRPALPVAPPPAPVDLSVVVVSDFSAPGGVGALPATERVRLVTAARQARSVLLYCRGDQTRPSRAGFRALIRRGAAVKRFLISQGVSPAKIRLFARSAGGFVADNATIAGRARNRRVEIHFA